ncbi:MAG: hypothetical protein HPY53_09955 [Brevinematales bacterium]|nr:hypothetical protein [Brevinematales bacterium]
MKKLIIDDDQISLDFAVIEGENFNDIVYIQQRGVGELINGEDERGNTLRLRIDSIIDTRLVVQILEIIPPSINP